MKYDNDKLRNTLASEYVLGTLHGQARVRFESLMREDASLRRMVDRWQQRIGPMSEALTPVTPPARVWKGIEQRLGFNHDASESILARFWNHLTLWRGLGLTTSMASFALVAYLMLVSSQPIVVNQYVAVMTNSQQQVSWMVTTNSLNQQATIKVLNSQTLPANKAFELWMLPTGQNPVSMGLLSASEDKILQISTQLLQQLTNSKALAVSLEPSGGSPTGLPTGPVLYQGNLQSI